MKFKFFFSVLILSFSLLLIGCMPAPGKPAPLPSEQLPAEPLIGGQRDEHGCLGPAGYSWNETVQACVREWELDEGQQKAAGIAVKHVGPEYATTIIGVDVARCPGCFSVRLEKGEERIPYTVTLNNWEVADIPEPQDNFGCKEAGGNWLSEYNECEYGSREWCEEAGGTYSECESACRHDPDAEICTLQCVMVCQF
ncbi:hypothetical protein JW752_02870 [Candidatus Peregrinibacteria bacterium]|nr:hypothetical protein [Candidatus Peregrinibacteria bacterium]